jgi:hypothetical protein
MDICLAKQNGLNDRHIFPAPTGSVLGKKLKHTFSTKWDAFIVRIFLVSSWPTSCDYHICYTPWSHPPRFNGYDEVDQSAYRLELGGISGVIATVDCLCRLYSIKSGNLWFRLDGEQAILHASGSDPLDPQQASFDLLVNICNKLQKSPLAWEFIWIEGHQKEWHGSSDSWGDLNEICTAVAKTFWNYVSLTRPPKRSHRFGDK